MNGKESNQANETCKGNPKYIKEQRLVKEKAQA